MKLIQRFGKAGLMIAFGLIILSGCGSGARQESSSADGFEMMIDYLGKQPDFVNSELAPGAIGIGDVLNYTGTRLHVIDIRSKVEYDTGHLAMAIHVPIGELLAYFEQRIDPASFDTIALISRDGNDAFFAVTLMRILGYHNVFGVKLGMGWHTRFAKETWGKRVTSDFEAKLSTEASPPKKVYPFPEFQTDSADGYSLIRARVSELLSSGSQGYRIAARDVFANAGNFYIINYWPENEYLVGHIPGAYQYTPKKSLSIKTELATIPPDRPVVVYCHQGNMSSSAVAYLLLLGYQVQSLEFGTNSFMYNLHKEKIVKSLFSPDEAIDYPLTDQTNAGGSANPPPVLVEMKSKGGC
jgi:rhodanese-related sulfurtransferase